MNLRITIFKKTFLPIIILLMIGFVILDQIVKKIVLFSLFGAQAYSSNFISIEIYKNYGIAFGLPVNAVIFYSIFILFIIYLASGKLFNYKEMDKKEILAAGLILSGALGNLIDRIRFGYIIDYINFGDMVIFNLADVFIISGITMLIIKYYKKKLPNS